jgi:hypothetical protein
MLYKHNRLPLGNILGASPIFTLVARDVEVALDDIMVYDILDEIKVNVYLKVWTWVTHGSIIEEE